MGCVNSRADNDKKPNVFQVMNVDDLGNFIISGQLEVTEVDIILYQRGKQPIKWPLRCLRRYGYDAGIFSFESGRRCSTGAGIYAFKCQKAEHLFNLVQMKIQRVRNNNGDDTLSRDLPVASHPAAAVARVTIPVEINPTSDLTSTRSDNHPRFPHCQQNGIGISSSAGSSSGPISPQGVDPPALPMLPLPPNSQLYPSSYVNEKIVSVIPMEHNNNKRLDEPRQSCRSPQILMNENTTSKSVETELMSIQRNEIATTSDASGVSYINIDICRDANPISPTHSVSETTLPKEDNDTDECKHAYMNISPRQECIENVAVKMRPPPLPGLQPDAEDSTKHNYANLDASEIENLKKRYSGTSVAEKSPLLPSTPTGCTIKEVNYAVLDLDKKEMPTATGSPDNIANPAPSPPESPNKPQKGYATIDFNKTAALSHSVNPNLANDNEGSRKTRHNSTINDLTSPSRHNLPVSE